MSTDRSSFRLAVHGGVGTIRKQDMTATQEEAYRAALTAALRAGYDVLAAGGPSVDAVTAAVVVLEDSPLFNAGRGAVFTDAGTNELDAALMDGRTLQAGAVANVTHIRNPITLARLVMAYSTHVMLCGAGAEAFAQLHAVEMVPERYFFTERRWSELQAAQAAEQRSDAGATTPPARRDTGHGTVGAVALDVHGNLAAGTSTGGTTNKRWGRIGDAPIIGAGTYATNAACAVSATGTGEFFIRNVVAYDICARMLYRAQPLATAATDVIMTTLAAQHGDGGLIAVDGAGNVAMPFNTEGMYRGYVGPDGRTVVKIYRDE